MKAIVPIELIEKNILLVRGEKVMLDSDLAGLYDVEVKYLKRQVRRNMDRFPEDFMIQLTKEEYESLRSHFGTSSQWGGRRYLPYAFTEQGVAMLSSVLRSKRAVQVNVEIMRTFVKLRQMLAANANLSRKLNAEFRRWRAYQTDIMFIFHNFLHKSHICRIIFNV